tara:strand:+ start:196 stop:1917 length:1722 start_codon:yes stop_codon:yes gene_type:complete
MDQGSDPHCMGCKQGWSREETIRSIGKSYYNKEYKEHRKNTMFDTEKARFPETMPVVERKVKENTIREDIRKIEREREELRTKMWELEQRKREKNNELYNMQYNGQNGEEKEKRVFIKKCPVDDCEGFLSSSWKCGVCSTWVCPDCFEIKGKTSDELSKQELDAQHTCDPNSLETAKMIKAETRGCPSCGVPIYKISGCDQMWCTQCKVAFSWRTGKRVHGVIHNPHFYEFQRQGGGAVVNAPNAQICGGIPGHQQWRDRMRAIFGENTQGGTYTVIRGYGNNRRKVIGPLEQHKKHVFEYLLNSYQHSQYFKPSHYVLWETRDTVESGADIVQNYANGIPKKQIKLRSFFRLMEKFHRGALHFMDTELAEIRRQLNQDRDNQDLRVKFLMKELTETNFKITLAKRDKLADKKRNILDVFELMGAVYTEVSIAIYNIITELARDIGPRPRYPQLQNHNISGGQADRYKKYFTKMMIDGEVQLKIFKMWNDIGNEFEKLTRVRIYCNKQLCKIGKSYNNAITIIDSIFETPKINIKEIKTEMKKPKNLQGLFYPVVKDANFVHVNDHWGKLKYI